MDRPLRICQVIPRPMVGGAEKFGMWMTDALLDAGHQAELITIADEGPLQSQFSEQVRAHHWRGQKKSRYDASVLGRLVDHFRKTRPDVVHTHLFTALSWAGVAARLAGVPLVVHTDHGTFESENTAFIDFAQQSLSSVVDVIVGCGPAAIDSIDKGDFAKWCPVTVIENGIPMGERLQSSLNGSPLRLATVGRLVPRKGITFLLEAMRIVKDQGLNVKLEVLGNGPLLDSLQAESSSLGLDDIVHFAGFVDDVPERLASMDGYVHPALAEAMPLAIIEAAAAGLPLILSDGLGVSTLLDAGAGALGVPHSNPQAIAEAITKLVKMPRKELRALGQTSRDVALSRYSMKHTASRYVDLYREYLRGGRSTLERPEPGPSSALWHKVRQLSPTTDSKFYT